MARRNRYPEIHSEGKYDDDQKKVCKPCRKDGKEERAVRWVRVSFTYMRGEDECTDVCNKHLQQIRRYVRESREGKRRFFPKHFQGDEIWS